LPVGQDGNFKSLCTQIVRDPATYMISEQNVLAADLLQAVGVKMVRMAVREPDVFGVEDISLALRRDTVCQSPTAEIGRIVVAEPRVGCQNRFVVIGDERCIARGRNAKHGLSFSTESPG
jgi:ABC-type antimicrobial peptide transport system ATPase subunit